MFSSFLLSFLIINFVRSCSSIYRLQVFFVFNIFCPSNFHFYSPTSCLKSFNPFLSALSFVHIFAPYNCVLHHKTFLFLRVFLVFRLTSYSSRIMVLFFLQKVCFTCAINILLIRLVHFQELSNSILNIYLSVYCHVHHNWPMLHKYTLFVQVLGSVTGFGHTYLYEQLRNIIFYR